MVSNSYSQENNLVLHDQAGRDINNYYIGKMDNQISAMGRLIRNFRVEQEKNKLFNETIDKIKHYKSNLDNGAPVGLETKLSEGNRINYIEFAQRSKESIKFSM